MHIKYNPDTLAPAYSNYAQATEIKLSGRMLFISGQCGVQPDGFIPEDFEEQCRVAFDNILKILSSSGMTVADIAKITIFMVDSADLNVVRKVRDEKFSDIPVSSSFIFVSGMIKPEFKLEIECIAAK